MYKNILYMDMNDMILNIKIGRNNSILFMIATSDFHTSYFHTNTIISRSNSGTN